MFLGSQDSVPDLQKVSAPMKQLKKCPKFVFNFQGIAPIMQPKKCLAFVPDLQKVSGPMKQPKKCPKFVQLAEGHCSDEAAEEMSGDCVQLAEGHCSHDGAEKLCRFCT